MDAGAVPESGPPRVAVIGGGFSGAAMAIHLLGQARAPVRVDIVEPRPTVGAGVAYSATDPTHRINVPAARMSVFADDPLHFHRWVTAEGRLANDPDATIAADVVYPRRAMFGAYMASLTEPLRRGGALRHVRDRAVEVRRSGAGYRLCLAGGGTIAADMVVVATSHPPPGVPASLASLATAHATFVANPWGAEALAPIADDDTVLIVGTALTMADTVASLDARGHRGRITAISRRGLCSREHKDGPRTPLGDFTGSPVRSAVDLVGRIKATLAMAARSGQAWQDVLDAVREQGPAIWSSLGEVERRRLLRHLRPMWDAHRYRIAPQTAAVLRRRRAEGSFGSFAASLRGIAVEDGRFAVRLRRRGSGDEAGERHLFDAVVLATGPAHADVIAAQPALASLAAAGLLHGDPYGLGVAVDASGRVLDAAGRPNDTLFVAGPLARGTVGELMGLPEVARHAELVASAVAARLASLVAA